MIRPFLASSKVSRFVDVSGSNGGSDNTLLYEDDLRRLGRHSS